MKRLLLLSALTTLLLSNSHYSKKQPFTHTYKGKLEIAGICMNYTISVNDGAMGIPGIAANRTDETAINSYNNVFKSGNPGYFPGSIKQGDEFYFIIDSAKGKQCAAGMAYYPSPSKKSFV